MAADIIYLQRFVISGVENWKIRRIVFDASNNTTFSDVSGFYTNRNDALAFWDGYIAAEEQDAFVETQTQDWQDGYNALP